VRTLCRALGVHPSSYYDWLKEPLSERDKEDQRLIAHIKQCWLESGGHAGYRNIHLDLIDAQIVCGRDRVLRLMQLAGLRAQRGYRRPRGLRGISECSRTEPTESAV
jgi:putative transposase